MMRRLRNMMVALCLSCLAIVSVAPALAAEGCPTVSIPRPAKNLGKLEIGICASEYNSGTEYADYEFTSKLIACIEGTIHSAVVRMMAVISDEFGWLTAVLATLVIMFYGIRVAMGERQLLGSTAMLVIKLAFIVGFMNMLPDIVEWVFGLLRDLLQIVSGGLTPWQRIDIFLGNLVGFGPTIVLMNGLLGLVGAAIFSSKVGVALFFAGIMAILNLLKFILQLVYTYALAFLTIGFLLVFMPIMIPLSLFHPTERYFKKWVDLIVSAIIVPVLLFAFVWMFVGIFDILIQNIFDILGGKDFRSYWRINTSLFSWVMPADPNTTAVMAGISDPKDIDCASKAVTAPVQHNITPFLAGSTNAGFAKVATLNFGSNDTSVVQRLSFAFMTLWIFASLMKSMVTLIPDVAASMAQIVSTRMSFGGDSQLVAKLEGGMHKMQSKLQGGAAADMKKIGSKYATDLSRLIGMRRN